MIIRKLVAFLELASGHVHEVEFKNAFFWKHKLGRPSESESVDFFISKKRLCPILRTIEHFAFQDPLVVLSIDEDKTLRDFNMGWVAHVKDIVSSRVHTAKGQS